MGYYYRYASFGLPSFVVVVVALYLLFSSAFSLLMAILLYQY
jgi:hypothetical protein